MRWCRGGGDAGPTRWRHGGCGRPPWRAASSPRCSWGPGPDCLASRVGSALGAFGGGQGAFCSCRPLSGRVASVCSAVRWAQGSSGDTVRIGAVLHTVGSQMVAMLLSICHVYRVPCEGVASRMQTCNCTGDGLGVLFLRRSVPAQLSAGAAASLADVFL